MNADLRHLALLLAAALLASAARVDAHPGAASDVVLQIGSRSVDVLLTTGARSLRAKLEALAGIPDGGPATSDDRQALIALKNELESRMRLAVDGRILALEWIGLEAPEAPEDRRAGKVVARMRSILPDGARTLTFRTSLILGSYPLIVRRVGQPDEVEWLPGPAASAPIPLTAAAPRTRLAAAAGGIWVGFTHIIPLGLDHILFVLGLFLLTPRVRPLLVQVSLFALAHTATLGLATLGVIAVPAGIVEPLIALSIAYIGFENLVRPSATRWRLFVVFLFGLLHGLGFAGALAELRLPAASLVSTLILFNIGVELGQIAVLMAAATVTRALSLRPAAFQGFIARPASVTIAAAGLVWMVERVWG